MNKNANNGNSRIAIFINKTKFIFITLFSLSVLFGITYLIFQKIDRNNVSKIQLKIEALDTRYTDLLNEYPLNEIHVKLPNEEIQALIDEFNKITDTQNKSFAIQEIYFRKGKLYILQKKYELAISQFELSTKMNKSSYLQPKTLAYLSSASEEIGNLEKAVFYLTKIIDNYSKSIEAAHATFSLGRISEIQDNTNNTNTAQGYYLSLLNNEQWEDSPWASLAKTRLALLGYTNITTDTITEQ